MATDINLDALFKEIYADRVEDLIPGGVKLKKDIKFSEAEKLGEKFVQPVMLSHDQGYTYSNSSDAFDLEAPVTAEFQQAEVQGTAGLLRTRISYTRAAKASKGKRAFVDSTKQLVENLTNSMTKRIEIGLFYGSSSTGLGTIESVANAVAADAVPSGSSGRRVVISRQSWAPGIWAGMEGSKLDVHTAAGTQRNVGSSSAQEVRVHSVDIENRRLVLVSETASNVAATTSGAGLATGNHVSFKGSRDVEFAGLDRIITNTGTLFNIDAGRYDLWRGNTDTLTENLSSNALVRATAVATGKGLEEDVCAYLSPTQYERLNEAVSNLRRFDSSYSSMKNENGSKMLQFHGQSGMVTVKPSIYCKDSDVFIIPPKYCKRIGATDMTFQTPGMPGEQKFFRQLENQAGYELRIFHHSALFIERPAYCTKLTVPTSLS